jgi:hypothetical protein
MHGFLILGLSVLLAAAGSCGTRSSTQKGPWSVRLTTSGGFAGVGTGNISVDSDGAYKYQPPGRPQPEKKVCEGKLTPEQLRAISDAVRKTNPDGWDVPGVKVPAPDAFGYKLELTADGRTSAVEWYDNTIDKLPDDLKQLSMVLRDTMKSACTQKAP